MDDFEENDKNVNSNSKKTILAVCVLVISVVAITLGVIFGTRTPYSSPSQPVIVCEGNLQIRQGSSTSNCTILAGNMTVDNSYEGDLDFSSVFPDLQQVRGDVTFDGVPLTGVNLHNLEEVAGSLFFFNLPFMQSMNASEIKMLQNLVVFRCDALELLLLPGLQIVR